MISGLILASDKFTVIGDWVDEVTVTNDSCSLSFDEFALFVLRGKTFNDSSVRGSSDPAVVVSSLSEDNDDDVAGWEDEGEGTFVFDCNDNVVISGAGVEVVVAAERKREKSESERKAKKL